MNTQWKVQTVKGGYVAWQNIVVGKGEIEMALPKKGDIMIIVVVQVWKLRHWGFYKKTNLVNQAVFINHKINFY